MPTCIEPQASTRWAEPAHVHGMPPVHLSLDAVQRNCMCQQRTTVGCPLHAFLLKCCILFTLCTALYQCFGNQGNNVVCCAQPPGRRGTHNPGVDACAVPAADVESHSLIPLNINTMLLVSHGSCAAFSQPWCLKLYAVVSARLWEHCRSHRGGGVFALAQHVPPCCAGLGWVCCLLSC
jgi:hypothetical protein